MKNKTFILILAGLISASAFLGAQSVNRSVTNVNDEAQELYEMLRERLIKNQVISSSIRDNNSFLQNDRVLFYHFDGRVRALTETIQSLDDLRAAQLSLRAGN